MPNVQVGGDRHRISSWVLGMYTDSPLSMWGDRLTGFGFGKRLGIIKRSPSGDCEVRSLDGRRLMIAALQPRGARQPGTTRAGAAVRRWMTRPLVGQLARLALARSHFRRLFDGPDVRVQGGLVATVAARLGVPMRPVEPEPWTLGVRLRHEPRGLRRHVVAAGSPADGCTIGELEAMAHRWEVARLVDTTNLLDRYDDLGSAAEKPEASS